MPRLALFQAFTLFPKLSPEIRILIWAFASLHRRTVNVPSTNKAAWEYRDTQGLPRLRPSVPGQARQLAIMEVNHESRVVGSKHYTLIKATLPRCSRCCCLCIILEDLSKHPVSLNIIYEQFRDTRGRRIQHTLSKCTMQHWVNFAIDDFAVKLTGEEHPHSFNYSTAFNFKKKDLLRIKNLSYRGDVKQCQGRFVHFTLRQLFSELMQNSSPYGSWWKRRTRRIGNPK